MPPKAAAAAGTVAVAICAPRGRRRYVRCFDHMMSTPGRHSHNTSRAPVVAISKNGAMENGSHTVGNESRTRQNHSSLGAARQRRTIPVVGFDLDELLAHLAVANFFGVAKWPI